MSTTTPISSRSISELLRLLLPDGTRLPTPHTQEAEQDTPSWDDAPWWPPDLFGACAYILEALGAYPHIIPGQGGGWGPAYQEVSDNEREKWIDAAREWRSEPRVPELVTTLWKALLASTDTTVLRSAGKKAVLTGWVKPVFALAVIADEACSDVGYVDADDHGSGSSWIAKTVATADKKQIEKSKVKSESRSRTDGKKANRHTRMRNRADSITMRLSRDFAAVQPKSRTPQVGCTLRTISHNLALLPPQSKVSATWQRVPAAMPEVTRPLNILLVPFPYDIEPAWVSGTRQTPDGDTKPWGWFDIEQKWISRDKEVFNDCICQLIDEARKNDDIHGVIFPEFSLNWETHESLVERLSREYKDIEFLISGSSTNCDGDEGNYVLFSTVYFKDGQTAIVTDSRAKHHRWRMSGDQIRMYGLQDRLNPDVDWWEGIHIPRRQMHISVMRGVCSHTALICEDLARAEPCHEALKSIGPNIVYCLLMDAPQIPARWPARYATGLSEDPGSAILTFTSRGLMQRQFETERANELSSNPAQRAQGTHYGRQFSWSVGLWRDDTSAGFKEIHCPPGDHAVVLSLESRPVDERTYDNRTNSEAIQWVYRNSRTIRVDSKNLKFFKP